MSRTYRRDKDKFNTDYYKISGDLDVYKNLEGRDKKPYHKSPSWYKKQRERARRAKRKAALKNGKEMPVEKKDNDWKWN